MLANKACTRRVGVAAFFGMFLARGFFRFDGDSTLRPHAGNAHRWAPEINTVSSLEGRVELLQLSRTPRAT